MIFEVVKIARIYSRGNFRRIFRIQFDVVGSIKLIGNTIFAINLEQMVQMKNAIAKRGLSHFKFCLVTYFYFYYLGKEFSNLGSLLV